MRVQFREAPVPRGRSTSASDPLLGEPARIWWLLTQIQLPLWLANSPQIQDLTR